MTEKGQSPPQTRSDRVRQQLTWLEQASGNFVHRLGVHPDVVSLVGLGFVIAAAFAIANGRLVLGGWLIFWGGWFDALDGAVARARGGANPFGAVLDSLLDRYADGFIFGSLSYYFAVKNEMVLMLLPLAAFMGSYAVSYVRARADAPDIGVAAKLGAFTRLERLVVVVWALWLHTWLLVPALWLLAIGTNLTAVQRLWFVKQHTKDH